MIRYYHLEDGKIKPSKGIDLEQITWCDALQPTDNEMIEIAQKFNINLDDLEDCIDETSRPRYNYDVLLKNNLLILHVVHSAEFNIKHPPTIPMGIFLTSQGKIITMHSSMPRHFENMIDVLGRRNLKDPIFLLLEIAHFFIDQLDNLAQTLARHVREMQDNILQSRAVKGEVQEPFQVNSYLIIFNTSVLGDSNALKLFFHRNAGSMEKNLELLEKYNDTQTDIDQIYAFTAIIRDVLANSLDAYNGLINNRLTFVMKVVGSLSLILMIPTIIASFYGMNVSLPGGGDPSDPNHLAFYLILTLSLVLSGATWIFFRKRQWL